MKEVFKCLNPNFDEMDKQSKKEDLQLDINRSTERINELGQEIEDAFSAIEHAKEAHRATCTEKLNEEKKLDKLIEQFNQL